MLPPITRFCGSVCCFLGQRGSDNLKYTWCSSKENKCPNSPECENCLLLEAMKIKGNEVKCSLIFPIFIIFTIDSTYSPTYREEQGNSYHLRANMGQEYYWSLTHSSGYPAEGAWGPMRLWGSPSTDSAPSFFAPCHFLSGEFSEFQWLSCTPGQGCWTWTKLLNPVETWLCFPNLVNLSVMVVLSPLPFPSPPFSSLNSAFIVLKFIHAWPYGWISVV